MRALWATVVAVLSLSAFAQTRTDPRAISIHPFVGQRGTTFVATLRGSGLAGASAVSIGQAPFTVVVEGLEPEQTEDPSAKNKARIDLIKLRVEVSPDAKPGRYPI